MRDEKAPAVYILASKRNGTLYVGVTASICNRIAAHRQGEIPGFTRRYGVRMLVWFESHPDMASAIKREKQFKEWQRKWKLELIEKSNPLWNDLYEEVCGG